TLPSRVPPSRIPPSRMPPSVVPPSLQLGSGSCTHCLGIGLFLTCWQRSIVHELSSLHSISLRQQSVIMVWPHAWRAALHESVVHASESLQSASLAQQPPVVSGVCVH